MVFEILGVNLLDLIKKYQYKGVRSMFDKTGAYKSVQKDRETVSDCLGLPAHDLQDHPHRLKARERCLGLDRLTDRRCPSQSRPRSSRTVS